MFKNPSLEPGTHLSSPPAFDPSRTKTQQYDNYDGSFAGVTAGSNASDVDMADDEAYWWNWDEEDTDHVAMDDNTSDIAEYFSETTASVADIEQELAPSAHENYPLDGNTLRRSLNVPEAGSFAGQTLLPTADGAFSAHDFANVQSVNEPNWAAFIRDAQQGSAQFATPCASQYGSVPTVFLPQYDGPGYVDASDVLSNTSSLPSTLRVGEVDPNDSIASFERDVNALQAQGNITTPLMYWLSTTSEPHKVFSGIGYPMDFRSRLEPSSAYQDSDVCDGIQHMPTG